MKTYRKILYSSLRNTQNVETAFKAGVYFAARLGARWAQEAEGDIFPQALHSEGTNTAGGYIVNDEISDALVLNRERYGAVRRYARIQPMTRDRMNIPQRTGGVTAYAVGEGVTITESTPALATVGLTAKKWGALLRATSELNEDAIVSFGDWIIGELGYAFALAEDGVAFNGDGTSTYNYGMGLKNALNAGAVSTCASANTWANIAQTDIDSWMALALDYEGSRSQCFYCSKAFYHQVLERLAMTTGYANSFQIVNGMPQYFFSGYPVHFTRALPTATATSTICAYFGDLERAVVLGDRRQVTVARSTQADVGGQGTWERDEITFKGTERVDIVVADVGGSSGGPIAALKTHS